MNSREAFEAWFAASGWSQNETAAKLGAVTGWNAAIQHASDVAVKACEVTGAPVFHDRSSAYDDGCRDCADAIKEALK